MDRLDITAKEKKALSKILPLSYILCNTACIYPEMRKLRGKCEECEFTKAIESLEAKI